MLIKDSSGQLIWYAKVTPEGIYLEHESFNKSDGVWLESAYKISTSEYEKLKQFFKISLDIPMSLILQLISEEGLGMYFMDLVLEGKIKSEKFFWYSWNV